MEDEDRTEWDKAWASMPHRMIVDTTKVDFAKITGLGDVGKLLSVTVSMAPEQYFHKMYISLEVCPVCGQATDDDRGLIGVSINPKFIKISGLGFSAWAHQKCFNECPIANEPSPIPW